MAWLVAGLLVVGPLGLGFLVGGAPLSRRSLRLTVQLTAAVVPWLIVWIIAPAVPELPTWDLLWAATLWTSAVLFGAVTRSIARRDVWLAVASSVVALLLAEVIARVVMAPPPVYPAASEARLWLDERGQTDRGPTQELERGRPWRCEGLYPEKYPDYLSFRAPSGQPLVAHIGDSMVEGLGVSRRFTDVLTASARAGKTHVNAGVSTTGPDYHHVLIKAWTGQSKLDIKHVVHHLYVGNDLVEIDYPYFCCGGEALLDWADDPPSNRCPQPQNHRTMKALIGTSPPPYVLRVTSSISVLARHLSRATERVGFEIAVATSTAKLTGERRGLALGKVGRIVRANVAWLAARDILYTVVVLPSMVDLAGDHTDRAYGKALTRDLLAVVSDAGAQVLDPTAVLTRALRSGGKEALYILGPDGLDPHFNTEGHRIYGDWLAGQLVK